MAKKPTKKKQGRKSRKPKSSGSSAPRGTTGAKFAGTVVMSPPAGGRKAAIANGTRVIASLVELSVGRLPEGGAKSELQCDIQVRTTDDEGKPVSGSWSSGVYYYVRHDSRLNIAESVIFDALVHQHLSFDFSLVEREMPRTTPANAAALAEAAAQAAAKLTHASGAVSTALEAMPSILGGILKLNGDDQVLKHSTSLYTAEVHKPDDHDHYLVEGTYRFDKLRRLGDPDPWVTLLIDIRPVV